MEVIPRLQYFFTVLSSFTVFSPEQGDQWRACHSRQLEQYHLCHDAVGSSSLKLWILFCIWASILHNMLNVFYPKPRCGNMLQYWQGCQVKVLDTTRESHFVEVWTQPLQLALNNWPKPKGKIDFKQKVLACLVDLQLHSLCTWQEERHFA